MIRLKRKRKQAMVSLLERAGIRLRRKKQDQYNAKVRSIRTVLRQTAHEEQGRKIADLIPDDEAMALIEAADPNIDTRATVELIKQREVWATKSAALEKLEKSAADSAKATSDFRTAEAERHRLAREKIAEMEIAAHRAHIEYMAAFEARQELIATAGEFPEEAALGEQLTDVSRSIDRCNVALSRLGGHEGSLLAAAESRREQLRGKVEPQRKVALERELAHYEKLIADRTKELAGLNKQRESLHAKLAKLTAEKLKPENFAIVRRKVASIDAAVANAIY
jgi:hypothetical protein